MRLLLLEDDRELGQALRDGLKLSGYAVNWVTKTSDAVVALDTEAHDVLLCASHIDKKTTAPFIQQLRNKSAILPIVVLDERPSPEQRVSALDHGADAYLPQPFSIDELRALIRAQLRRQAGRTTPQITVGALTLDPTTHAATLNATPLNLTAREFALLEKLAENAGRTVSKSRLEETLYAWNEEVESNAVEVHVHRLRKKLGPGFIRTLRGIGYVLDVPATETPTIKPTLAAPVITPDDTRRMVFDNPQSLAVALQRLYDKIDLLLDGHNAFTDDAVRELRRPLTALHLQTELALNASNQTERDAALHEILRHIDRARHVLDIVVDLSRLDNVTLGEIQRSINLCRLCEESLADVADAALKREIDISLQHDCSGEVWGRPDMLSALIRSLTESVILHAQRGAHIDVAVHDDQQHVRLTVSETPGPTPVSMSASLVPPPIAPRAEYGELTLTLAKRVARLHGAQVEVKAGAHGPRVTVTFPRSARGQEFDWQSQSEGG